MLEAAIAKDIEFGVSYHLLTTPSPQIFPGFVYAIFARVY